MTALKSKAFDTAYGLYNKDVQIGRASCRERV